MSSVLLEGVNHSTPSTNHTLSLESSRISTQKHDLFRLSPEDKFIPEPVNGKENYSNKPTRRSCPHVRAVGCSNQLTISHDCLGLPYNSFPPLWGKERMGVYCRPLDQVILKDNGICNIQTSKKGEQPKDDD